FFSSRRRHTRFSRDWSRRVLFRSRNPTKVVMNGVGPGRAVKFVTGSAEEINILTLILPGTGDTTSNIINNAKHTNDRGRKDWLRSEERRVGKESGSRWGTSDERGD